MIVFEKNQAFLQEWDIIQGVGHYALVSFLLSPPQSTGLKIIPQQDFMC